LRRENVEDVYRLSPAQQGMLFHCAYGSGAADPTMYLQQFRGPASERELSPALFARALQRLIDAHPILRTSFLWEGMPEPVQVVARQAALPLDVQDWSGLPAGELDERFARYAEEDRRRGFDLTRAPLLRAAATG
jgi:hypothetical protein